MIHILDPSRSVEGNFVQYTVATTDGRVINGLLASETKTSVELLDAEAKRQVVLREDIDEMAASKKSLMPEGFEKQVSTDDIRNLLAFLTQPRQVPAARPEQGRHDRQHPGHVLRRESPNRSAWSFPTGRPRRSTSVPFVLVDPESGQVPNVVLLYGPEGKFPPQMPRSVELPCNAKAKAIHFLSGVSGWGYPYGAEGQRLDDRPAPLRRRLGRGPPAGKRRPLRRLYPRGGRPRLEARLQAPRPAGPLPRRPPQEARRRSSASSWSRAPTSPRPIVMAVTVEVGEGLSSPERAR